MANTLNISGRWSLGLCIALAAATARADLSPSSDTVVDERATTIAGNAPYGRAINGQAFQGQALTSFEGYQYAIYWVTEAATAPAAHVAVARRKLPDGPWQVIDLTDSPFKNGVRKGTTNEPFDAHNTCSIGICPSDGTIHIAYDHHNNPLRYRVSAPGAATASRWDASVFQPERAELVPGRAVTQVCYPYFERTPEGDMQLFVRRGGSGDGSWWVWDYSGKTHAWTDGWQYDDGRAGSYYGYQKPSPFRSSYPNAWTYGPDGTLHSAFVWRESGQSPGAVNHDVSYIYSQDRGRTWKNNAGEVVGDRATDQKVTVTSPGIVVIPTTAYESLMNTQAQAVDPAGRVHLLMYHLDSAKKVPSTSTTSTTMPAKAWQLPRCSYFHHWRDDDGTWRTGTLPMPVGTRPQLVFDDAGDAYAVFANGPSQGIYGADRSLVLATATAATKWSDWKVLATVPGPFHTEPLIDVARVRSDGVLSVVMQESPKRDRDPTRLRVIDFKLDGAK